MPETAPLLVRISPDVRVLLDKACERFHRSRPMQVRAYLLRCLRDDGIIATLEEGDDSRCHERARRLSCERILADGS